MSQDTFIPSGAQALAGGHAVSGRPPIDRFEMKRQWTERTEEERVEEAAILYEKAARQRLQGSVPEAPPQQLDEEELEAMSQELKLRQMCQDIAALIMVEELEDELDEEEE